jgi:putative membrane protein
MVRFILRALVVAVGFWVATHIIPDVHVTGWKTFVAAAVVLGLVNAFVRPIVTFLTLPATILTLGLFLLVVNGAMILLMQWLLHQFGDRSIQIGTGDFMHNLVPAILTSIVIWAVSLVGNIFLGGEDRDGRSRQRR